MESISKSSMERGSTIGECNGGTGDGGNGKRNGKRIGDDILFDDILLFRIHVESNFVVQS